MPMTDAEIAARLRAYGLHELVLKVGYPECQRWPELRKALPDLDLCELDGWRDRALAAQGATP